MDVSTFPTKGNLLLAKANLQLSIQGYDLLDKKRNILISEMMALIQQAEKIQSVIDTIFSNAYKALQRANVSLGINSVQQAGLAVPEEDSIQVKFRSIMGVEIPLVDANEPADVEVTYSFYRTNYHLDMAYENFNNVKKLIIEMASVENTIYRLANHIKKTQKRANALKSIMIPKYKELVAFISNSLEEREREESARLHVIKEKGNG